MEVEGAKHSTQLSHTFRNRDKTSLLESTNVIKTHITKMANLQLVRGLKNGYHFSFIMHIYSFFFLKVYFEKLYLFSTINSRVQGYSITMLPKSHLLNQLRKTSWSKILKATERSSSNSIAASSYPQKSDQSNLSSIF